MKIAANLIDQFVQKPDKAIQYVLFYGPDNGLITERSKKLASVVTDVQNPFNVIDLPFEKLKDDPALLADELVALSFSGDRRLIRVLDVPASIPAELKNILTTSIGEAFIIFTGGDLPANASFRQFFEKEKKCASLPCYKDDARGVAAVIIDHFKKLGMTFDREVVLFLQDRFQGDRQLVLNELDKLVLYMGQEKHITVKDAEDCIGESAEGSLDELCNAVAFGNATAIEHVLERLLHEGMATVAIMRALMRYFLRLHSVKVAMTNGIPEDQALTMLRPPLFFKQLPLFKQQLRLWKEDQLIQLLQMLNKAELSVKTTGNPAETICRQLFAVIALRASVNA